jgi:hypothetical protein
MKNLIIILGLMFVPSKANLTPVDESITIIQINAKWNQHHNVDLSGLNGCKVQFAWLEDQNETLKNQIKRVPVIMMYKGNNSVRQWKADISFTLDVNLQEIQSAVNEYK